MFPLCIVCDDAQHELCRLFQRLAAEDVISRGLGKCHSIQHGMSAVNVQDGLLFVCVKIALAFKRKDKLK